MLNLSFDATTKQAYPTLGLNISVNDVVHIL